MAQAGDTASSDVLFERNGRVATVILNAPERLNALSNSMMKKIGDAMTADWVKTAGADGQAIVDAFRK